MHILNLCHSLLGGCLHHLRRQQRWKSVIGWIQFHKVFLKNTSVILLFFYWYLRKHCYLPFNLLPHKKPPKAKRCFAVHHSGVPYLCHVLCKCMWPVALLVTLDWEKTPGEIAQALQPSFSLQTPRPPLLGGVPCGWGWDLWCGAATWSQTEVLQPHHSPCHWVDFSAF